MKQISIAALALALFSLAPAAGAQTSISNMTVDAVNVTATSVVVTGVVQGESVPSSRSYSGASIYTNEVAQKIAALDRCHRSLLLALSKPGQYVAKVSSDTCTVALVAP